MTEVTAYDVWQEITTESGVRLDTEVAVRGSLSRSYVQTLILAERVRVNGEKTKANYRIRAQDIVEINLPAPALLEVVAEDIALDIVYEDEMLLVVNKPQGMVVHPAPGAWDGTLVNALLYHCHDLSGVNGVLRPGIVHRIDKDTSGLLLVAKNDQAHRHLAAQIKAHSVKRSYHALVRGLLTEPSGTINAPIGRDPRNRKKMTVTEQNSRQAVTHYEILQRFPATAATGETVTEIKALLETGRTHQIRVHMAYIGHPVLGDPVYGRHFTLPAVPGAAATPVPFTGQALHAETIGFVHPVTEAYLEFSAPPPAYFSALLSFFSSGVSVSERKP